jgi:hypothetical protein
MQRMSAGSFWLLRSFMSMFYALVTRMIRFSSYAVTCERKGATLPTPNSITYNA